LELRKKLRDKRHRLLMMLARKGNENAFARLYGEVYDPVAAYVNRRVMNQTDAEDLISDIFRKFLLRMDSFDGEKGSVLTWVVSIARNAVIDHHRRVKPVTVDSDELAELLAGGKASALQTLIQEEELLLVHSLLQKQPPLIREMFDLRFGQGLMVREVAEVVGISFDAAKQRFARATKQLQAEWAVEATGSGNGKGGSQWAATD